MTFRTNTAAAIQTLSQFSRRGAKLALAAVLCTATFNVFVPQAGAYPRIVRIYCKSDYKRFCPRYKVGSARMRRCMQSYAKHLSPVCKKALIDSGLAAKYGY